MRIRFAWLFATALAYGLIGGNQLYAQIWGVDEGLSWAPIATDRLLWAAFVFLVSTLWLRLRHSARRGAWVALHATAAFLLGAGIAWGVVEYLMFGSQHGWDTDIPGEMLYCSCARRAPIIRQTLLATLAGMIVTAVLAPLIAHLVNQDEHGPGAPGPRVNGWRASRVLAAPNQQRGERDGARGDGR